MKFVDMKNKPKKTLRGATKAMDVPEIDEPAYPWGLEISLNEDSIKKLKLDVEDMAAGDDVYFFAKAKVTRLSLSENLDSQNKKHTNGDVGLQIQKMSWGKPDL